MGPKPKKQKREEALARMMRTGPAPQGTMTAAEYGVYLRRRLDEIDNIERKIAKGR